MTSEAVTALQNEVKGRVILPEDSDYDETRAIWNAMIDRRPAVIVQCAEAADSGRALKFARDNDLEIAIRGAGHNIAGNAVCDGGMLIDHSNMKGVRVDADKKRAYVEPGATLGDFDATVQANGLATPVGINSTTGIAGLTLGGGFGWMTRKYGMTVDNLVSVDVTLANGDQVRASADKNPDLFWAIRGGGGNFGIVTQFEFALHEAGPEIMAGLLVFPMEQAKQVLEKYRQFVADAPEELSVWAVMRLAPPLPFLPEDVHGKGVVVLALCYVGDPAEGEGVVAPLHDFGKPYGTHVGAMPFVEWQQAFDGLLTPGARNYWKSHNFTELSDGAFDSMIEYANKLPSPQCEIFVAHIAGAANRVPADAMAYGHRDANFVLNVHGRWDDPSEDEACIGWARDFFNASQPYASTGAYINFMTEDETARVESAFGSNHGRLIEIKKKYDPENVFHLNQNITAQ
jgi:FAD/FMN-containing dehydrogenase